MPFSYRGEVKYLPSLRRNFGRLNLVLVVLIASCVSKFSAPDHARAKALWERIQGTSAWTHFDGLAGLQEGDGSHGAFIETRINPIAAEDQKALLPGSILVKSNFSTAAGGAPDSFVAMERQAGYDPRHKDWFYATFDPRGRVIQAGSSDECIGCHRAAGAGDYVFYNDF